MQSKPALGDCITCRVVSTRNAYKIVLCSVSYYFTDSKIYTGDLSLKAIRVLRLINSRLTTFIIITMMNWGSTDPVHICIMRSWKHIKSKE